MDEDQRFVEMVDVCIHTFRVVNENGTAEMKILARSLLFEIGKEAVRRVVRDQASKQEGGLTKQ